MRSKDCPILLTRRKTFPPVTSLAEFRRKLQFVTSKTLPRGANMQEKVEGFRLSPQQNRVWLFQQKNLSAFYSQVVALIRGSLQEARLRQAIAYLVDRHEILRTVFHRRAGLRLPFQVVTAGGGDACAWRSEDLSRLRSAERQSRLEELLAQEREQPWAYETGPLLRLRLARLSPQEHALLVTLPALCADSRTLSLFVEELAAAYGEAAGDVRGEAEEVMQYADVSQWQNELLEAEEGEPGVEHWRARNWAAATALTLPFEFWCDEVSETASIFRWRKQDVLLSAEVVDAVKAAADARRVSVAAWLQTCWSALLWRLCGRPAELIIGVGYDARKYDELAGAWGLLTKQAPVRVEMNTEARFSEALEQVEEARSETAKWQEYFSWEKLGRGASSSSTTSGTLTVENRADAETLFCAAQYEYEREAASPALPASDLTFSLSHLAALAEPFKVKLHVIERPSAKDHSRLRLELLWDSALLTDQAADCLASQLRAVVRHSVESPSQRVTALPLLTQSERRRVLFEWNDTGRDYPSQLVHEMFEAHAERSPHAVAVVCQDRQLTYGELNKRANQLARFLRAIGVGAERRVALLMERSVEMVVALLATLKAGGAYAPLDPQYPRERLALMLADSGADVLLTQTELRGLLPESEAQVVEVDVEWGRISLWSGEKVEKEEEEENPAYIIYTSGSTGRPKGVMIEHRQLSNYVHAAVERLRLPEGASYATVSTFAADLGHTMIFPALSRGGALHVLSRECAADGEALWEYLERHRIDCLKIVPSHIEALCDGVMGRGENRSREGEVEGKLLESKLRRLVLGGEASRWGLIERLRRMMPGCEIYNHYGPTETTVGAVAQPLEVEEKERAGLVGLGRPMGNMRAYVMCEWMDVTGVGEAGELYIGGAGVGRGYLGRAEQTAERYVPDPYSERGGERLYRTGDVARYRPDGAIEFLGRVDNQIKIRGFRVEIGEIETALISHPSVREAAVIAIEDAPGEKRLIAYVVGARRQLSIVSDELRAYLKERLPEYMLPLAFIQMDALPLSPNGKVDRRALPAPEQVKAAFAVARIGPRTPLEEILCGIWQEVLGAEQVGVTDNFFELGGHSLLVTQIISRVREIFRVELPVRRLFDAVTIEQLSSIIVENETKPGQTESIARTLKTIRNMPEEERRKILQRKRREIGVA
jgi:amino acid adenylation domain-containing protein